jgi:hypothetical protein
MSQFLIPSHPPGAMSITIDEAVTPSFDGRYRINRMLFFFSLPTPSSTNLKVSAFSSISLFHQPQWLPKLQKRDTKTPPTAFFESSATLHRINLALTPDGDINNVDGAAVPVDRLSPPSAPHTLWWGVKDDSQSHVSLAFSFTSFFCFFSYEYPEHI